jgi:hypothetical protein
MPSKSYRQQVRMSPETRSRIAELAAVWAGPEGPLTPSAVIRVAVERAWNDRDPVMQIGHSLAPRVTHNPPASQRSGP